MQRVLSGIQPSGDVHLGNLLGALQNWVADQHTHESFHPIVDLHAVTVPQDPAELQAATLRLAQMLMASGLDPDVCVLFVQSHVPEHTQLAWVLECTAGFGELRRMHQFKDKSADMDFVCAGLFTYPVLQAADIVLYDTDVVPVGDDQRQHIELTRDITQRFNARYGEVLVVPEHRIPPAGARVMDLQEPTRKMSKSAGEAPGTIWLLDEPEVVRRKIRRAVTDSEAEVRFDREAKPGVSNLLEILGAATGRNPQDVAAGYDRYGELKNDCAEAVVELLAPIRRRFAELSADPGQTRAALAAGAETAGEIAAATMARVRQAMGFLPRP